MKRLLLLSNDSKLKNSFIEYYKDSSFYCIKVSNTIDNININKFDAIILDYFMCNQDGYNIIKSIKIDTFLFIILPNVRINMFSILKDVTINYLFFKPVNMSSFDRIINLFFYNGVVSYRRELLNLFKELGLSYKLLGTKYLFYIISAVLSENIEINEKLYDLASEHFNVDVNNIIKDISYAIKTCFDNPSNLELKKEIFGYSYSIRTWAVSNLTFIYNICIYISYCAQEKEYIKKN